MFHISAIVSTAIANTSTKDSESEQEDQHEDEETGAQPIVWTDDQPIVWTDDQPIVWTYNEVPRKKIEFTKNAGLDPMHHFKLIATDEFFEMLCTRTNNHAIDLIALSSGENPRIVRWIDVLPTEMKIFLGILLHMGTIRLNRLNETE
ncbi:hypothetical protein JTB14_031264 [Gonioctena quinquepunctata]|nr:hypothetical protein JTB14_031264 [Gonioctena quinquepunctata]